MSVSQVTWQDLQQAPDDGKRREAIRGDLYATPAPGVRHQRLSGRPPVPLQPLVAACSITTSTSARNASHQK